MNRKQTVSLCMIVKNEEDVLGRCLSSIKSIVDEIIIVDTGSTDNTIYIAKEYGAKVFEFQWQNDFSAARNYSISKAKSKWILILDADEVFNEEDCEKFQELIRNTIYDGFHFVIHNYMCDGDTNDYTIHYAFRLLRNNHKYKFEGKIHEQIIGIVSDNITNEITSANIVIYHFGYMNNIIKTKNKRARNIPILKKQLEEEPNNAFYLFNMGNEYMAQNLIKDALKYYILSYEYKDIHQAYCPHLLYRIIICLLNIKEYKRALTMVQEALVLYPKCTDIEFCRALIHIKTNEHLLAIMSLNQCINMGEPPTDLKFINGCGTFRPYIELGEIYLSNESYRQAIEAYNQVLCINSKLIFVLYKIGKAMYKLYNNKDILIEQLSSYFNDINHIPNRIILVDILIQEKLYDSANIIIESSNEQNIITYEEDVDYIKFKLLFYQNKYKEAREYVEKLDKKELTLKILKNKEVELKRNIFVLLLIMDGHDYTNLLGLIENLELNEEKKTYQAVYQIINEPDINLSIDINLDVLFGLLEIMLKAEEFEFFEKTLEILNRIEDKNVLIYLAKLYYKYGYKEMAINAIYQSIKELDRLDAETAFILSKEIV